MEEGSENWGVIFDKLAIKDGTDDGQIEGNALIKWLSAMNLEDRMEFEKEIPLSHHQLQTLVKQADKNNDGFVNKDEFQDLLQNKIRKLDARQQSYIHQYFKVVAYAEEYSWYPPPWFVLSLALVQMILFYVQDFRPGCSYLIYSPFRKKEVWRFFTYIFIHVDNQHLWMNLCLQITVGLPLEMSHGTWRVAVVYASGVISGSLATSVMDSTVYLAGSSGGIYALVAAHFATLVLNWKEDLVIIQHRLRNDRTTVAKFHGKFIRWLRLLFLLLYVALDIFLAIRRRFQDASISYVAHLFGALSGLMVGIIVLKNRKVQCWEVWLKNICILMFFFMTLFFVIWNLVKDLAFDGSDALDFSQLRCTKNPI